MITIYTSNVLEKEYNTYYKKKLIVKNEEDLTKAVSHDYVAAKFKEGYRSNDNFIEADAVILDIDNDRDIP